VKTISILILLLAAFALHAQSHSMDPRFRIGEILFSDDFNAGLDKWTVEAERPGTVEPRDGRLTIDVPAGCTVWFKPLLTGPVMIEYEVTAISAGGANDRVSDLNCFWMARDARAPDDIFRQSRSGKFEEYNPLRTYYVGLGGNGNTTTRFRRYIGDSILRPLLPEHDLKDAANLIVPNVSQRFRLIACGSLIQFWRDDKLLFEMNDPEPYTSGWFAFRTVANHMTIRAFRVHRLEPIP
jgi:hypothetical protein